MLPDDAALPVAPGVSVADDATMVDSAVAVNLPRSKPIGEKRTLSGSSDDEPVVRGFTSTSPTFADTVKALPGLRYLVVGTQTGQKSENGTGENHEH